MSQFVFSIKKMLSYSMAAIALLLSSSAQGQQMANYRFTTFTGSMGGAGLGCTFWTSANMPNWFITGGTPQWVTSGSLRSVLIWEGNTSMGHEWESFAGNYNFYAGTTYFLKIGIEVLTGGGSTCNNSLKVIAANGLTEIAPASCGGAIPVPTTSESIGDFISATPVSHKVFSVTYTPSINFNQILFYLNSCDPNTQLTVRIDSVSIATCFYGAVNYTTTSELAGGLEAGYRKITAGSGSPSSVVSVDPGHVTRFLAESITLLPAFSAQMNSGEYFLAKPIKGCEIDCSISGPRCVRIGHDITLTGGTPGGTWTSSNPAWATVSSAGVVHGVASSGYSYVAITYTIYDCSTTYYVLVSQDCDGSEGRPGIEGLTTGSDGSSIEIYPNPAQSAITISYPCKQAGQLDISIKDVSGRVRHSESVLCSDNATAQQVVDINDLPPGVYFVELTLNGEHTVKKIVKL